MIPYIYATTIQVGPIPIQVWGTMVALGVLAALLVMTRRAKRLKQDHQLILDTAAWVLLGILIGARAVHILFYDVATYLQDPIEIFRVWHGGLSSIGGFIGGGLAGLWRLRQKQVDVWAYADTMAFGIPLGLGIGRIGCFLIHDHPGTASDLFFAVEWPDGESRLDHGLLLAVNGLLMAGLFAWLGRKKWPPGFFLAVFGVWYGPIRFFLDFFRADDATYLGLTPAQYAALAMFAAGVYWLQRLLRSRSGHATIDAQNA